MITDFKAAKKTLRTSDSNMEVIAINGCCYGINNHMYKDDYFKYCGQKFWEFISGETELYIKLIEPLGTKAREKNHDFMISYSKKLNKFTRDFSMDFCNEDGAIDWEKLVKFNSEMKT